MNTRGNPWAAEGADPSSTNERHCDMKSSPSKNLKASDAPGSVSGEVEIEEPLFAVVVLGEWDLTKFRLAFHAAACAPCPCRPVLLLESSRLIEFCLRSPHSLPSPLRLCAAVLTLKDAICWSKLPLLS